MNVKKEQIENWRNLAQQSEWSVVKLAKACNTSVRTLERHFHKAMGTSPKVWLFEERQNKAKEFLHWGHSVKETAILLGYSHAHHFSRDFKKYFNYCPTDCYADQQF